MSSTHADEGTANEATLNQFRWHRLVHSGRNPLTPSSGGWLFQLAGESRAAPQVTSSGMRLRCSYIGEEAFRGSSPLVMRCPLPWNAFTGCHGILSLLVNRWNHFGEIFSEFPL